MSALKIFSRFFAVVFNRYPLYCSLLSFEIGRKKWNTRKRFCWEGSEVVKKFFLLFFFFFSTFFFSSPLWTFGIFIVKLNPFGIEISKESTWKKILRGWKSWGKFHAKLWGSGWVDGWKIEVTQSADVTYKSHTQCQLWWRWRGKNSIKSMRDGNVFSPNCYLHRWRCVVRLREGKMNRKFIDSKFFLIAIFTKLHFDSVLLSLPFYAISIHLFGTSGKDQHFFYHFSMWNFYSYSIAFHSVVTLQ